MSKTMTACVEPFETETIMVIFEGKKIVTTTALLGRKNKQINLDRRNSVLQNGTLQK